jgi:glycosyltransferase involved in cell wall biosynthesis
MACGSPIVARDTPFNREVLGPAFQYVEPRASAIVMSADKVMKDRQLQELLSRTGKIRAASKYSWDCVNAKYEEILSVLANYQKSSTQ